MPVYKIKNNVAKLWCKYYFFPFVMLKFRKRRVLSHIVNLRITKGNIALHNVYFTYKFIINMKFTSTEYGNDY